MKSTTTFAVVSKMRDISARWGIPEIVFTDNGPQFTSKEFASSYWFTHHTSSLYYARLNGEAERAVQTAKIITCDDPFIALLSYRTTPIPTIGYSTSQLILRRQVRTTLPALRSLVVGSNQSKLRQIIIAQTKKAMNFDKHHGAQKLKDQVIMHKSRWISDLLGVTQVLSYQEQDIPGHT